LSLGAAGIQMGTRFVCANECTVHKNYKDAIIKAKDRSAVVTGRSTGHPVRVLKNKLAHEFEILEKKGATVAELEALGAGKLRAAVVDGDVEYGSLMSGQIAGMINDVKPASAIILDIITEAKNLLHKMSSTL
jgi:enoyl-[acyl-carrier protein] reductase II